MPDTSNFSSLYLVVYPKFIFYQHLLVCFCHLGVMPDLCGTVCGTLFCPSIILLLLRKYKGFVWFFRLFDLLLRILSVGRNHDYKSQLLDQSRRGGLLSPACGAFLLSARDSFRRHVALLLTSRFWTPPIPAPQNVRSEQFLAQRV